MAANKSNSGKEYSIYLTPDELFSIEKLLNRTPNDFELNMFAAMWSEHISYKSSASWIEKLPSKGDAVVVPAGKENAGVIDLGDGLACVIKMESHNHPTAVNAGEAAVGVGNIFRDIMSMGAQPIAHLNIMRFGNPEDDTIRQTVGKIIKALGSYSNNFGVPVVGGEILFDKSYAFNPLLNYMAVGLVSHDKVITSSLKKKDDLLFVIGRKTSGTGVHGAGFASSAFKGSMKHLVPETQLADPHAGRILCDCLQELNNESVINSMQDVGAGGVLCAAAEMAFRGDKGVDLNLDEFPLANQEMAPIDILLSQSQEQMLISVSPSEAPLLKKITSKWNIQYSLVGKATSKGRIKVNYNSEQLADLPVASLVHGGGAPVYIRDLKDPGRKVVKVSADEVPFPGSLKELAKFMIQHQNVASRKYIYEQFDTFAGLSNVGSFFPADAGVLNIPGSKKLLALSVDGNSRYVRREPRIGSMIAVAEAARNIICTGGRPVAIADGLNFGDPSDLHVYHDFVESVKGIRIISERMGLPVVAGNVSFNNLTISDELTVSVQPTPVIGMAGIIDDFEDLTSVAFKKKGDMIYLLGRSDNDLSGSEYLAAAHLIEQTAAPVFNLDHELKLHEIMSELIRKQLVLSAHDVSIGGLFVALVECSLPNTLGFDITSPAEVREDAFLFGESQSRIIVSVSRDSETSFLDYMMEKGFPFSALGHVTKQELRIDDSSFGFITDYARDFENSLKNILDKD